MGVERLIVLCLKTMAQVWNYYQEKISLESPTTCFNCRGVALVATVLQDHISVFQLALDQKAVATTTLCTVHAQVNEMPIRFNQDSLMYISLADLEVFKLVKTSLFGHHFIVF